MSAHIRIGHPKEFLLPTDVEGFESLAELALDLRWTWNHATDQVWRKLDPVLWELTQNPWSILQTANGCGWKSPCPVTRSGCAPGRFRSVA